MSTDMQVKEVVSQASVNCVEFWGAAFTAIQNMPDKGYVYRQFKTTKGWVDAFLAQQRTGIPDLETWIRKIIADNRDK
jgi:hypothetical protein